MAGAARPTISPPREPAAPPSLPVLFRRHARSTARLIVRLGGEEQVERILADIFLKAGRRLARVPNERSVQAWLFRLTCDAVASRRRREGLRGLVTRRPVPPSPLGALPPREREALVLAELDQLEVAEIATLMSTTALEVERLLGRARERLGGELPAALQQLAGLPLIDDLALARVRARVLRTSDRPRTWPRAVVPAATFAILATAGALALAWNPPKPVTSAAPAAQVHTPAGGCGAGVCR